MPTLLSVSSHSPHERHSRRATPFDVYAVDPAVFGLSLQVATSANTSGGFTCTDNPALNGNPNGIPFATSNWNPGGSGGTYDNQVVAVFYYSVSNRWCIWNEGGVNLTLGAAFNVLGFSGPVSP